MNNTDKALIRMIIDNDCHVSMRSIDVVKYIIDKLKNGRIGYYALPKKSRRALWNVCYQVHRENFKLYAYVMGGRS